MLQGKVEICGVNTARLETIKETEKTDLIRLAQEGNRDARDRLVSCNLKLVLSVIQRFMNRGELPDDLFQVGCIGLIKAIDNFDLNVGVRFSTYAVPMIMGELRRFMRDNNALRVSRSVRDLAYRSMQERERLQGTLGRDPTVNEIAAALGCDAAEVLSSLESSRDPVSLYESVFNDGGDSVLVMDGLDAGDSEEDWISEIAIRQVLSQLSEREREILSMRYIGGSTQTAVAERLGISQAQVSRIEKNAIKRIKKEI